MFDLGEFELASASMNYHITSPVKQSTITAHILVMEIAKITSLKVCADEVTKVAEFN
jgi:hypothetical protein